MAVPVEPDGPGWKIIAGAAWLLLTGLFAWIANVLRNEQKDLGTQLATIRSNYVNRDDLERHLATLRADNLRMHHETRSETMRLHGENEKHFEHIERKLDQGSHTRHDIRDGIHATQLLMREVIKEIQLDREAREARDRNVPR